MNKTQQIAQGWVSYSKANGLKPNTKKYIEFQHAFLNGAHSVVQEDMLPAIITIYAMTGRDVADLVDAVDA